MALVHLFALDTFEASRQRVPDPDPAAEVPEERRERADTGPDEWDAETLDEIPEELESEDSDEAIELEV